MRILSFFSRMAVCCLSAVLFLTSCGLKAADGPEKGSDGNKSDPDRQVGLYVISTDGIGEKKWGYMDAAGNIVIQPVFDYAEDFQENGLAVAGKGGKQGLIDESGKFVVAPVYEYIDRFSEGLAVAWDSKRYKALDEKGKVIYQSDQYIGSFRDGRAVIEESVPPDRQLYGYIDTRGEIVIKPVLKTAYDFNEGKAVVGLEDGGYGLIDRDGKLLRKFSYASVRNNREGMMAYKENQDGKFGYLNIKGDVAIPPKFSMADNFRDGFAVVDMSEEYNTSKTGLIDKKGRFVIKPEYNEVRVLGEGMIAAGIPIDNEYKFKGSKYAIADSSGTILTDFIFYGINDYKNGIASVYDRASTYFIDRQGKPVHNLPVVKGAGTLTVMGDLIKADVDSRVKYLARDGRVVWAPSNEIELGNGIVVREVKFKPNRNYLVYYPRIEGMKNEEIQENVNRKLKEMAVTKNVTPDMELDYNYEGDFDIELHKKNLLLLKLSGYNYPFGAAHGMPNLAYAHVDLKTGKFYELKDLFKKDSDYVRVLSDIIGKQIKEHGEEMSVWEDSYEGIKPDQPFYITENALNIYFQPYEIAPYAAGFPTFTIPYREIKGIIDTEGDFWRAFN